MKRIIKKGSVLMHRGRNASAANIDQLALGSTNNQSSTGNNSCVNSVQSPQNKTTAHSMSTRPQSVNNANYKHTKTQIQKRVQNIENFIKDYNFGMDTCLKGYQTPVLNKKRL